MSLNESIVEDAALEWFGEQSRVAPTLIPAFSQGEKESVGHGPHLAPGEYAGGTLTPALSQGGREQGGEVVLVECLREAIRQLNPANACDNPHPASPTGRGEEASPVRCAQTGGQSLQILQQFKPE